MFEDHQDDVEDEESTKLEWLLEKTNERLDQSKQKRKQQTQGGRTKKQRTISELFQKEEIPPKAQKAPPKATSKKIEHTKLLLQQTKTKIAEPAELTSEQCSATRALMHLFDPELTGSIEQVKLDAMSSYMKQLITTCNTRELRDALIAEKVVESDDEEEEKHERKSEFQEEDEDSDEYAERTGIGIEESDNEEDEEDEGDEGDEDFVVGDDVVEYEEGYDPNTSTMKRLRRSVNKKRIKEDDEEEEKKKESPKETPEESIKETPVESSKAETETPGE
jgi:hypothetical protein